MRTATRQRKRVMHFEREEIAGHDYDPSDPAHQKWAHEKGSIFIGDQKVPVKNRGGTDPLRESCSRRWMNGSWRTGNLL
jgi:hypothetical protein